MKQTINEKPVPFIRRTIDGSMYTVMIHFNQESKETAKEKIKRLLIQDTLSEYANRENIRMNRLPS